MVRFAFGGKRGLLKKAASGVLAIFPCSRSTSTFRAQKWLRPSLRQAQDWTNPSTDSGHAFLNRPVVVDRQGLPSEIWPLLSSLFNTPKRRIRNANIFDLIASMRTLTCLVAGSFRCGTGRLAHRGERKLIRLRIGKKRNRLCSSVYGEEQAHPSELGYRIAFRNCMTRRSEPPLACLKFVFVDKLCHTKIRNSYFRKLGWPA